MVVTHAKENIENGPGGLTDLTPPESGDWVGVGGEPLPVEDGVAVGGPPRMRGDRDLLRHGA